VALVRGYEGVTARLVHVDSHDFLAGDPIELTT
jgi:hypothetical protein